MSLPTFTAGTEIRASEMNEAFATIFDMMYPVGSIYMSATLSTASAVNNALPGTWQAWGAGRVPVGVNTNDTDFNTAGKTGGEKTHKLTVDEMPEHSHEFVVPPRYNWEYASGGAMFGQNTSTSANNSQNTGNTGGNQPHNNLQPYITCYMYKRVS